MSQPPTKVKSPLVTLPEPDDSRNGRNAQLSGITLVSSAVPAGWVVIKSPVLSNDSERLLELAPINLAGVALVSATNIPTTSCCLG